MAALLQAVKAALKKSRHAQPFDPLSPAQLKELESTLPCPIPADVRELLSYCTGFAGCICDFVDLTGKMGDFELRQVFPSGLPIAGDEDDNYWVVDLGPDSRTWSPIYYVCHDPKVIVFHTTSLQDFLVENLADEDGGPYSLDLVHEEHPMKLWKSNPLERSRADFLGSGDEVLRAFAEPLAPEMKLVDLRTPKLGDGFAWGRFGEGTRVIRHASLPIFAYGPP